MRIMLDGAKTDGQLTMLRSAAQGGSASPVQMIPDAYLTGQQAR